MKNMGNLNKRLTYKPLLDKILQADNLRAGSKFDEAIQVYQEVLNSIDKTCEYDICECYRKIGDCYYLQKKQDGAREAYEKTLRYCTTNAGVYAILAYLYYYLDNDAAINYYSKAIKLNPKDESSISSKCLTILKSHKYNQKLIKETFENEMLNARQSLMAGEVPFRYSKNDLKDKKKLHIGYLSSDFYNHAMMQFVLPLLRNHDKAKFDFTLYSTAKKEDSLTEIIKQLGMNWSDCRTLNNKQLANKIHEDKIDILVDLGGFTHNRCYSLLYKPAPIQMQYLGFVNTLGMSEVDYIFADEFTIPKEMAKYYTEKPLYLDTWMQRFNFDINDPKWPGLDEAPYKKNGYVTFGSFNCPSKLNDYTLELWARLLKNVENSKLLIYRSQITDNIIKHYKERFEKYNVDLDRIIFDNSPMPSPHFKAYQRADIALDTTPFNGLTITMELIAMGVPVLTLAGNSMQSRGCARVNKALGLDELVTETAEQYIEKGKMLAADKDKIDFYRKNLRTILAQSPLTSDVKGFAQKVEAAYTKAWNDYLSL